MIQSLTTQRIEKAAECALPTSLSCPGTCNTIGNCPAPARVCQQVCLEWGATPPPWFCWLGLRQTPGALLLVFYLFIHCVCACNIYLCGSASFYAL